MTKLKKRTRWAVLALCLAWLLALPGCGKAFVVDGPGMEYRSPWTAFTLTGADSDFWFTVTDTDDQALVTGKCSDEKENSYTEETGVEISGEDLWQLRWMDLDQLPDAEPGLSADMADITLVLTLSDGTVVKKNASGDLSIEIYKLLLPYLKNN